MSASSPLTRLLVGCLALLFLLPRVASQDGAAPPDEDSAVEQLPWSKGPGEGRLGGRARIPYGQEFRFLGGSDAARRLEMSGNRVDEDSVLGLIEHRKGKWWIVFEFDDTGYIKDDEKNDLDATKLLESYRKGIAAENERREGPPTKVIGWQTQPNYNEATHNLEWAIIFETGGSRYINHNVRVLGRRGVMRVTLVEDMDKLEATLPLFREALGAFKYVEDESYAAYKPGDKIAKYGLAALVTGGAALGAAKLGLFAKLAVFFKKFLSYIVIAVVAAATAVKRFFRRLFGMRSQIRE